MDLSQITPTTEGRLRRAVVLLTAALLGVLATGAATAQASCDLISVDTVAAEDRGGEVAFCVALDFSIALRSERFLDGERVPGAPDGCDFETQIFYPYFTLPGQGARGPYRLTSWTVDGRALSGDFVDVAGLAALLNALDPGGDWTADEITKNITGGAGDRDYGPLEVRQVDSGRERSVAANRREVARGALVSARGPGFHEYVQVDPVTGCRDTLVIFLKPRLPERRLALTTEAGVPTEEFCVDNGGLVGVPQAARFCHDDLAGTVNPSSDYCFVYVPAPGFTGVEEVCIEVCDDTDQLGGPVCQITRVTVTVGGGDAVRTDTLAVAIAPQDTIVCLADALQEPGPYTRAELCAAPSDDVTVAPLLSGCVALSPRRDFAGETLACVLHCAADVCDTTFLRITVTHGGGCDAGVFPVPFDSIGSAGDPTPYCLPLAPEAFARYEFSVDGAAYAGPARDCDEATELFYNYAPVFMQGRAGPYTLFSWIVDGVFNNGRFADIPELLALMRQFDPEGNWTLDAANLNISGGVDGRDYGDLVIVHDATGTRSELRPNPVGTPRGTSVDFPGPGTYRLALRDPVTGCTDSLTLQIGPRGGGGGGTSDTFRVDVANGQPSPRICLFDAPRGPLTLCREVANGTIDLDAEACVVYTPAAGFSGSDTLCVLSCSFSPRVCDTVVVIFQVAPPVPADTLVVRVTSFGDSPLEACAQLPFPGPYAAPTFCGIEGPYVATAGRGSCLLIDPADGTTEGGSVCVTWCSATEPTRCQPVRFLIDRVPACPTDVLAPDTLRLPSAGGAVEVCLGDGADLSGYEIALDGAPVTPGQSADCGTTVADTTGGTREVFAYDVAFLTDGALRIDGWEANGAFFEGITAADVTALADTLSALDPAATWAYDATDDLLVADTGAGSYSPLILFDLGGGFAAQLPLTTVRRGSGGGTRFVPGATVTIPAAGTYVVTVRDRASGCGDRQVIILGGADGPTRDTIEQEVIADQLNGPFCLDVSELPGAPTSIETCGDPRAGTLAFTTNACYTYAPDPGYVGPDTACVVVCAGAVCDTTIIAFDVVADGPGTRPTRDTIVQDVRAGQLNGPYCLSTDELPAGPYEISSCALPQNGQVAFENGTCYTYTPDADFAGRDTTCLVVCADSGRVCDTTIVILNVIDAPECETFAALTPLDFVIPNCEGEAVFEFSTGNVSPGTVRLRVNGRDTVLDAREQVFSFALGVGDYTIVASDTVTGCASFFEVGVDCDDDCLLPFAAREYVRYVDCARDSVLSVCLPTTLAALEGYSISLDDSSYVGELRECGERERVVYDLGGVPADPYRVDNLRIGTASFSGDVPDLGALADSLSAWDEAADWTLDTDLRLLTGGSPDVDYGVLRLTSLATGETYELTAGREFGGAGVAFDIPLGAPRRNLRFVRDDSTCLQDIFVELICISSAEDDVEVEEGGDLLYCVDAAELNGPIVSLTNVCGGSEDTVAVDFDAVVGCVTLRGVRIGERRLCLVACDALGVCDTTYVNVRVVEPGAPGALDAVDDDYRLQRGVTLEENVLANDSFSGALTSVRITRQPLRGTATLDEDGDLTYVSDGDACGFTDTLRYEICQDGVCDQAVVTLRVRCDAIEAYRGFSPNGDGINDFFVIEGIEAFPASRLQIYNRWGNEVYAATGYRNDWGGTWDEATLTDGTYFWVLDLGDGEDDEVRTGWVFLWR